MEDIVVVESNSKEKIFDKSLIGDGFNYSIAPCRFFLRLLGAWPDPKNDNTWISNICLIIAIGTMFLFATLSQTIKLILKHDDLNTVMEILTNCNIPTSIATVKIASLWYHRYVLKDVLNEIIEDWKMPHNRMEKNIMWKNAKISRFFSIGCIFMTESTLTVQCIVGLLNPISIAMNSNSNESIEWPLYMIGSFPYDDQVSPNYELSMFGQFMSNVFASTAFSSADSFFVVLIFHLIGQLSILKMSFYDLPEKIDNVNDRKRFMDRFTFIHSKHVRLWRFSSAIEESFNMMFLIQLVPCIFALGTQGYQLIMITEADNLAIIDLIFMFYFLVLFLSTIFAYCYVAELLRQESLELSHAVYDCDWTILPSREAKLLILLIARTQHPFEITAGKFTSFSLQLYCRILKTAAGYLSMLLAVKDRMVENEQHITEMNL